MAFGAAMGALTGNFARYGIGKGFIAAAQETIQPGTSALFVLVRTVVQDAVMEAVEQSGLKPDLFCTNLSNEQEKRLRKDFGA
jgi:uncharacterized membrane protein